MTYYEQFQEMIRKREAENKLHPELAPKSLTIEEAEKIRSEDARYYSSENWLRNVLRGPEPILTPGEEEKVRAAHKALTARIRDFPLEERGR